MWDNAGAQEDLYRSNRDDRMLPTTEKHLAQVGREISGNVLVGKQVCSLNPPITFISAASLTPVLASNPVCTVAICVLPVWVARFLFSFACAGGGGGEGVGFKTNFM